METDLRLLEPYLKEYIESITTKSRNGKYICPFCGSGTGKNKTAALSITKDGLKWRCFACGAPSDHGGDIFDFYEMVNNCDRSTSARELLRMYGSSLEATNNSKQQTVTPPPSAKTETRSFLAEIERFHAALKGSEGEAYLSGRGLSIETMERFKLGYDRINGNIIIPYNPKGSYYAKRTIRQNVAQPHDNLKGVKMPLFNQEGLYNADVCFVTESTLCAISIMQAGGTAVSTSGAAGIGRLIEPIRNRTPAAAIAVCMDADDVGRKATEKLAAELDELGIFYVDVSEMLMGDQAKDPNDLLQTIGAEAFAETVAKCIESVRSHRSMAQLADNDVRKERTGSGMIDSFLEAIQTRKYEPLPTGIADIDKAIGGGFIRQQLILLGAAPGAGKTAMAQWIFEGMAKRGISSVYLNLEMSRDQILARSFSRITAQHGARIKAVDILQGYKWTEEQRNAIMSAAEEYKRDIAPFMVYNPEGVSPTLEAVLAYIEKEARAAEQAERAAPCVVIDYLQIIGSEDKREEPASIIKRAMSSLKDYAIKHNTIVFVIMANNRESNRSGDVTMESGRDTSAIEYGADLQLGLALTACLKRNGQKAKAKEDLTPEERKQVTLKVTKARFANPNAEVDLIFDGETMTYTQVAKEDQKRNTKQYYDMEIFDRHRNS